MKEKKIILGLIFILLAAVSVSADTQADPLSTQGICNGEFTVAAGRYIPFENNSMPVGEHVTIVCRHEEQLNIISVPETVIGQLGYYMTVTNNSLCAVGDKIQSRVDVTQESSDWEIVEEFMGEDTGWGFGIMEIFGVPEYTTAAAGILILFTGAGIAYVRRKIQ